MKQCVMVRSTISSPLLRSVLFKGFTLAFLGIFILVLAVIFIPASTLQRWGWLLFLLSFSSLTLGLLPYRRLSRLQLKPHKLVLVDLNHLAFYSRGEKILTLALQSISKISYVDHARHYGIAISLKPPPIAPIVIHQPLKEVKFFRHKGCKEEKSDLFFPYFSPSAYHELLLWQEEAFVVASNDLFAFTKGQEEKC